MREAIPPKASEKLCLWTFYDLSEAHEVPCDTLTRFMLLLNSEGTAYLRAKPNYSEKRCLVTLYGPIADDVTSYATESEGRLKATYMLSANIIHDMEIGPTEEERASLVRTVRKKGKGLDMKVFCESLNLARVK